MNVRVDDLKRGRVIEKKICQRLISINAVKRNKSNSQRFTKKRMKDGKRDS